MNSQAALAPASSQLAAGAILTRARRLFSFRIAADRLPGGDEAVALALNSSPRRARQQLLSSFERQTLNQIGDVCSERNEIGDSMIRNDAERGQAQAFFYDVVLSHSGSDCLIWPFYRTPRGYAQMKLFGKKTAVHRLACMAIHGDPPSAGHHAAHECGNGAAGCVNPSHLAWKTAIENEADKWIHHGGFVGPAKLTPEQVLMVFALKGRAPLVAIARQFGVTTSAVRSIHKGKAWSWLTGLAPRTGALVGLGSNSNHPSRSPSAFLRCVSQTHSGTDGERSDGELNRNHESFDRKSGE